MAKQTCSLCHGTGKVMESNYSSGQIGGGQCPKCKGTGQVDVEKDQGGSCLGWVFIAMGFASLYYAVSGHTPLLFFAIGIILNGIGIRMLNKH